MGSVIERILAVGRGGRANKQYTAGAESRNRSFDGWAPKQEFGSQEKDHSNYACIEFTMVLRGDNGDLLPLEELQADPVLNQVNWGTQRGGIEFTEDQAAQLELLWRTYLSSVGKAELRRS